MDVAIHETGHSLDLLGAYGEQLSGTEVLEKMCWVSQANSYAASQDWLDNYNQDPNVPDDYAQTNQVEVRLFPTRNGLLSFSS